MRAIAASWKNVKSPENSLLGLWNESSTPFLRICARLNRSGYHDDGSTDDSLEMLKREPKVELRQTNRREGESYILLNRQLYNDVWKESRGQADWVIVGNIDEFVFHGDDIRSYLAACTKRGVTVVPVIGFEMVSRQPVPADQHLLETVRTGAFWIPINRFAIFDPNAIKEINYKPGRHSCSPKGNLVIPKADSGFEPPFQTPRT